MAEQLDVFFGATSDVESHVYLRWTGARDATLSGYVDGPYCEYSSTLPARISFGPTGTVGEAVVCRAILPDPCFWTPELPAIYRVKIDVAGDSIDRQIGIRTLGVAGSNFLYAGQRYVLRVVDHTVLQSDVVAMESTIEACRETGAAILVGALDEVVADLASRHGVLLVVNVDGDDLETVALQLRRLARWPAVAIAVLNTAKPLPVDIGRAAPNVLLAHALQPLDARVPDWVQVVICDSQDVTAAAVDAISQPVMAVERVVGTECVAEARRLCDELQRKMAPIADLAGYIVGCDNELD